MPLKSLLGSKGAKAHKPSYTCDFNIFNFVHPFWWTKLLDWSELVSFLLLLKGFPEAFALARLQEERLLVKKGKLK